MLQPVLLDARQAHAVSRGLVRSLGLVVLAFGVLVLLGWVLDLPLLKTLRPGWDSTKANTAFCLVLLGLSLTLSEDMGSGAQRLRMALATAVFFLAGATLTQDILGFDARITRLFSLDDATGSALGLPGRMSPATAFGIALASLSIMTMQSRATSQRLAIGALAFGTLALVGLIYGVDPFVQLSSMSLISSLGLILTAVGALFLRPNAGLPAALLDTSTSGTQLRRLLPTALLVPIAIGAFSLAGREADFWTVRTEAALVTTATMLALLAFFLTFYQSLRKAESERLHALQSLTESEERYRKTFQNALVGIAHLAGDGTWVRANERICEILGYTEEELKQQTYGSVSELEDLQVDAAQWEMLRRGEINDYGVERRFRSKRGEQVVADVRLVRDEDNAGELQHFTLVMQDITGRKISEGTLRVYERALAGTQNGISIADATRDDMPLVYANRAFLEMTGYEESEVIGNNCRFLNRKARDQSGLDEMRAAIEAGEDCTVLLRNHRKDGSGFWNQLSIAPVEDDDGKVSHFVGIMTDVTAQVQDGVERDQLLQDAKSANEAKDRFLAVVSHELRSPLNAVLAWSSILEEEAPNETVTRAAAAIEAAVRSQTRLVDDLLDVSRIRGEKLEVRPIRMELGSELRTVIDQLAPIAREREVKLSLSAPKHPLMVDADPERIAQIIRNLVDNALKFTPPEGQVSVILSEGPDAIRIEVRDTGAGLTPDSATRIFDEFWQAETPGSSGVKGLGLGLAIVRYLVERHGGRVEAQSDGLEKGTRIWIELPRPERSMGPSLTPSTQDDTAAAEEEKEEATTNETGESVSSQTGTPRVETSADAGSAFAGLEIVVVDDEKPTVEALAQVLENRGAIVRRAYSVAEALRFFDGSAPDFLVSDIGLPDRSGIELIRMIREMESETASILAIAVTGMADPEARGRIHRAGFNYCLSKPVAPETIIQEISRLRELDQQKVAKKRKLLLISDDATRETNDPFFTEIEEQGHSVRWLSSSECSLEALRERSPEFVLLSLPITSARIDAVAERVATLGAISIAFGEPADSEELTHFDFVLDQPLSKEGLRRILAFQEPRT